MSQYSISKTRLFEGIWEGIVTAEKGVTDQPHLEPVYEEKPLDQLKLVEVGEWTCRVFVLPQVLV